MSTSEHEIDDFTQFAKSRIKEDADTSLDELFDEWRATHPPSEDALAIQASIRDMENGEVGRSFDEFAADFRARNNLSE